MNRIEAKQEYILGITGASGVVLGVRMLEVLHGVDFDEATTVFMDPYSMTIHNPAHSTDEQRYIDIGTSDKGRVLVVVYTERGSHIRLIGCRMATSSERKLYEEAND